MILKLSSPKESFKIRESVLIFAHGLRGWYEADFIAVFLSSEGLKTFLPVQSIA
jgi:hypothetical protein